MTRWLGSYPVEKCYENGFVKIRTICKEKVPLLVSGYRLKLYKRPFSKEDFTNSICIYLNLIRSLNEKREKEKRKTMNKEKKGE